MYKYAGNVQLWSVEYFFAACKQCCHSVNDAMDILWLASRCFLLLS